jgi:hypothetical protein
MIKLSASRIKSFQSCSYLYYCNYILKLPRTGNSGSSRGSITHYVLEALFHPKRRNYYDEILAAKDPFVIPSIKRFIEKHAEKLEVNDQVNIKLIKEFILTGLSFDFFCAGAIETRSEEEFDHHGEGYRLGGFIDKTSIHHDKVKISDYKCSKGKFSDEELQFNVQALSYALITKKKFPHLPVEVEFLFLKFKNNPRQKVKITDDILAGFESFLVYISDCLNDFTYRDALANMAINDPAKRWLCGKRLGDLNKAGEPAWICEFKYPMNYFALYNDKKELIKTSKTKKDLDKQLKDGYTIEQEFYKGCPVHTSLWTNNESNKSI